MIAEATNILSKCIPPHGPSESTTGLVLGYVQSGKTMSFTTVAALARDNSYPMVIVITGVSNPLLDQSTRRLEQDLRLQKTANGVCSETLSQPTAKALPMCSLTGVTIGLPEHRRKTVLITVLKNTTNLTESQSEFSNNSTLRRFLFSSLTMRQTKRGSTRAVGQGAQSTTYQRLVTLRQNLPHHAYLQYTATPQAPLLINIIDVLSPRFVDLLTPGADYVGGADFFQRTSKSRARYSRERDFRSRYASSGCAALFDSSICNYFFLVLPPDSRLARINSQVGGTDPCLSSLPRDDRPRSVLSLDHADQTAMDRFT